MGDVISSNPRTRRAALLAGGAIAKIASS